MIIDTLLYNYYIVSTIIVSCFRVIGLLHSVYIGYSKCIHNEMVVWFVLLIKVYFPCTRISSCMLQSPPTCHRRKISTQFTNSKKLESVPIVLSIVLPIILSIVLSTVLSQVHGGTTGPHLPLSVTGSLYGGAYPIRKLIMKGNYEWGCGGST